MSQLFNFEIDPMTQDEKKMLKTVLAQASR